MQHFISASASRRLATLRSEGAHGMESGFLSWQQNMAYGTWDGANTRWGFIGGYIFFLLFISYLRVSRLGWVVCICVLTCGVGGLLCPQSELRFALLWYP